MSTFVKVIGTSQNVETLLYLPCDLGLKKIYDLKQRAKQVSKDWCLVTFRKRPKRPL